MVSMLDVDIVCIGMSSYLHIFCMFPGHIACYFPFLHLSDVSDLIHGLPFFILHFN